MKITKKKQYTASLILALIVPMAFVAVGSLTFSELVPVGVDNGPYALSTTLPDTPTPMRRAAFVASNPYSYVDDFAYMAAVPTSIYLHNGTQYISPLIHSVGSDSEKWLVGDWAEYLGDSESITQAISIGDFSDSAIQSIQTQIGTRLFPRIRSSSSAEIAGQLALMDWTTSANVVIALSKDSFQELLVTSGSATHTFDSPSITPVSSTTSVTYGSTQTVNFTPPASAGWMIGTFDWIGTELLTHTLYDPLGSPVDYSVYSQVFFERSTAYVPSPVPLYFWYPCSTDGMWTMALQRLSTGTTSVSYSIEYHPGFSETVNVPYNAKWLNVSATWDNSGTDLNFALISPEGRLVTWAPAESILAGPLSSSMKVPYPSPGAWTIIGAWMNPEPEQNNAQLSWSVSSLPNDLSSYLESAANGAVLASLMNAPLLYVDADDVPEVTSWTLSRLGTTDVLLVDPLNIHATLLESQLSGLVSTVHLLENYSAVTNAIHALSGNPDLVLTVPTGTGDEFYGPAAFSGAYHGAPVLSLTGGNNLMTTAAEETWAPYFVGPDIDIYVQNRWTTRTENGWYDERIPNKFSMESCADAFEAFIADRGAYASNDSQEVVIYSPTSLLKISFDRSLQSHFSPGRIPAPSSALASVFANRAALHRFLFMTSENADEALLSLYAYTDGAPFVDNFYNGYEIRQIDDSLDALQDAGFNVSAHVGAQQVFDTFASQIGLWSFSTHGTLTLAPRDPPDRPDGLGIFSLRDADTSYGYEYSEAVRDYNNDRLVNPVLFEAEAIHHITRTTDDLDAALDNIGSPIVILTACLLGGSRLPLMLMEHGAVGVTASPRTVYFQPAGMLSIMLTQALCDGNATGVSLSNALSLISSDFTDPLETRDPRDYANQQVLFGDPSVKLYIPDDDSRISALDPTTLILDGHTPAQGAPSVLALGATDYLTVPLVSLAADFEYYQVSNYSSFEIVFPLARTVLIEPATIQSFAPLLSSSTPSVSRYVKDGGALVIFGASGDMSWLPWPLVIDNSESGLSIDITDTGHPLVSNPNPMNETIGYQGYFSSYWRNFTVLVEGGGHPVLVAGVVDSGKAAITTTNPAGTARTDVVENAIRWGAAPSISLNSIQMNQYIIWEGDRVVLTLEITDRVGVGLPDVSLDVQIGNESVTVIPLGLGLYTVTLTEDWTRGRVGTFDVVIYGQKNGYDTLSLVLVGFITIRPFPLAAIVILGGAAIITAVGYLCLKRRRGETVSWKGSKGKKSKQERDQQKQQDERFDPKDFFGVS
ncbi:MAG: hypothetical protein EAX95_06060 [Candidatus Thorarchaeota archaeon]|nr:hypothetical protein [Candidatus Thorarchaeota archaeon]